MQPPRPKQVSTTTGASLLSSVVRNEPEHLPPFDELLQADLQKGMWPIDTSSTQTFSSPPVSTSLHRAPSLTSQEFPPGSILPFDSLPFSEMLLSNHMYACPVCNVQFSDKRNFRHHYMVHSGEKPYACNFCPYRARQNGTLKNHIMIKHRDELKQTTE